MSAPLLTNRGPVAEKLGEPWTCDRCDADASPAYVVEATAVDLGPEHPQRIHLVICSACERFLRTQGLLVDPPASEVMP